MAENSSTSPATGGNTTITGSAAVDSLSGGGGSDTIFGGSGADRLSGDAPLSGQWRYSVYDRNFSFDNNQTQFISSGSLVGHGYVDDFGVRALRNTLGGTAATSDRDDYGVIYQSNLAISATGTYTFSTSSDDGSRIIIRDASGNIVFNLNNDFHQAVTTRSGSVTLTAGQTYSIEVYFWENAGGDSLSATIAGPGFAATDLATSTLLTTPPLAPGHVDGDDSILGDAGNDTITGGGGNDRLYGGADSDSILGEAGQDQIYGGDGADRLFGGSESDLLYGSTGNDSIEGGTGNDTLLGEDGDDSILGEVGADSIFGGIGNDRLYGGTETDTVAGDAGQDQLYGGEGADQLSGGDDADLLYGGIGADTLSGGAGNDTLFGEDGNDLISGSAGADSLFGGADRDYFSFQDGDFSVGDSVDGGNGGVDFDTLDLSGYGWARTDITYTTPDRENGYVDFYSATGTYLGRMFFTEIEEVIPCFTLGTLIDTPGGPRPVESIQAGDLVLTLDAGPQVVRWVGHRALGVADLLASPDLRPVALAPGALGPNLPERTLTVSPQHRMLLAGATCELCFGEAEVLVPAIQLAGQANVCRPLLPVTYVHLMFDRHQIVRTHGVWSESFQPGAGALGSLPDPQRDEFFRLFPDLASGAAYRAARPTLKAHETRILLHAGL
jgi:Ca2+-binding RTX toxin-like protein